MYLAKRGLVIIIVVVALVAGLISYGIFLAAADNDEAELEDQVTELEAEVRHLETQLEATDEAPDTDLDEDDFTPDVDNDNDDNTQGADSEAEPDGLPTAGPS